jgi:hypothetical protein
MKKSLLLSFLFVTGVLFAGCSEKKYKEKHYQTLLCNELDGVMEQSLLDRTRVDCLTDVYAIEVDFAKKWAESVGQSLYYAEMTGKKPAVGFIVRDNKKDRRHLKRLEVLAKKYHIKIFKIDRGE